MDEFLMIYLPPSIVQPLALRKAEFPMKNDRGHELPAARLSPPSVTRATQRTRHGANGGQSPAPGSRQAGTSRTGLSKGLVLSMLGRASSTALPSR